jgi:hypothetical protein
LPLSFFPDAYITTLEYNRSRSVPLRPTNMHIRPTGSLASALTHHARFDLRAKANLFLRTNSGRPDSRSLSSSLRFHRSALWSSRCGEWLAKNGEGLNDGSIPATWENMWKGLGQKRNSARGERVASLTKNSAPL